MQTEALRVLEANTIKVCSENEETPVNSGTYCIHLDVGAIHVKNTLIDTDSQATIISVKLMLELMKSNQRIMPLLLTKYN